jgi:hypothetical protein
MSLHVFNFGAFLYTTQKKKDENLHLYKKKGGGSTHVLEKVKAVPVSYKTLSVYYS